MPRAAQFLSLDRQAICSAYGVLSLPTSSSSNHSRKSILDPKHAGGERGLSGMEEKIREVAKIFQVLSNGLRRLQDALQ